MDIDNTSCIGFEQYTAHNTHITSKTDKFYVPSIEKLDDTGLILLLRAELLGRYRKTLNTMLRSTLHNMRIWSVADKKHNISLQLTAFASSNNRLKISTLTRSENSYLCLITQ